MHEQHEAEEHEHRGALAVPVADPSLDQEVGDQEHRQREERGRGHAAAQAGEQQSALAVFLACALVLGERRVEEARADAAEAERHREELGRDRVQRRGGRSEHDPDDDDVGREHDLVRDVDEEVAPAERDQLAHARPGEVDAAEPEPGELAAQPGERERQPQQGRREREGAEQDQAAAARNEQRHEHCVEHRADEVGEILDVEALLAR